MVATWKVIITFLIVYAVVVDASANRARRRRRHVLNDNAQSNGVNAKPEARQQPLSPSAQVSDSHGKNFGGGQGGRQYNQPYQNGWSGGQGGQYPPYQYYGQNNPNMYGNQFYQNPGYGGYGSGYNGYNSGYGSGGSSYMNRPGYSNYNPSYGGYSGGYFWNSASKSTMSIFNILLTSLMALYVGYIAI